MTRVSPEDGNSGLFFIYVATNTWFIDLGAIDHMTSNHSLLNSLIPSPVKSVQVANGTSDRPKTRCVKCVPKCASVRVAPSNIVYYCTDIDPQGKVN